LIWDKIKKSENCLAIEDPGRPEIKGLQDSRACQRAKALLQTIESLSFFKPETSETSMFSRAKAFEFPF
jgi:hypothetical protein